MTWRAKVWGVGLILALITAAVVAYVRTYLFVELAVGRFVERHYAASAKRPDVLPHTSFDRQLLACSRKFGPLESWSVGHGALTLDMGLWQVEVQAKRQGVVDVETVMGIGRKIYLSRGTSDAWRAEGAESDTSRDGNM